MRLVLKRKSSDRVLREFPGDYYHQIFIPFENFLKGLMDSPDFVDFREYRLLVYKK